MVLGRVMDVRDHIEAAIKEAGSEAKLGEATGYTQHAIWRAKIKGRVSPEMALKIHRWSGGKFPASLFRPDLWPTERHVPSDFVTRETSPPTSPDDEPAAAERAAS